ncbi:MAG: TetR/AcrR family transcriptional regulator [Anaerolineales bacterium]|nr:TetR/AcrR family transcriptional regulator [Anaerolineales bacterium]
MGPKRDVSEERRAQILEAAAEVFTRAGFAGARMDDIAEQASLSKGSLYWYFDSKEDIIMGILDAMVSGEFSVLQELNTQPLSAEEKLVCIMKYAVDDLVSMEPMLPIMFEYWGLIQRQKKIRDRLGSYYKEMFAVMAPIIKQGVDSGEFRPVDVDEVVIAMGAVFEGMIVLWAAVPEQVDLQKNIIAGVQLILDGIRVEQAGLTG